MPTILELVNRLRGLASKAALGPLRISRYDHDDGDISWQAQQAEEPFEVVANLMESELPQARAVVELLVELSTSLPALLDAVEAAYPSASDEFFQEVAQEIKRARAKHPDPGGLMVALTEEAGELARAIQEEPSDRVRAEAVQVACVAFRVAVEGDPTLDSYREKRGVGPHPDAPREMDS